MEAVLPSAKQLSEARKMREKCPFEMERMDALLEFAVQTEMERNVNFLIVGLRAAVAREFATNTCLNNAENTKKSLAPGDVIMKLGAYSTLENTDILKGCDTDEKEQTYKSAVYKFSEELKRIGYYCELYNSTISIKIHSLQERPGVSIVTNAMGKGFGDHAKRDMENNI